MAGKTVKNKVVVSAQDKATPALSKIKKEFRVFSRQIKGLGNELKGLGSITALPIAGAFASAAAIVKNSIGSMVSYGGAVDDASRNLTIASDALQAFRYAADQSGSSASQMDSAIAMLNKNMANAANGSNKNLVGLMNRLGISMRDSNGKLKDAAQLMPEVADAIKSQTTATQKAYIATQFFGKSGQGLIKTLNDGSAGLAAQREEAEKFGVIMGEEDVAAATLFGDSLTRTRYATQGLQNAIGGKLLPILQPLLDDFNDWIAKNREWIATTIVDAIKDFADSLKDIDLKSVVAGFVKFVQTSAKVFNAMGGLKTVGVAVASLYGVKVIASIMGVGKAMLSLIPTIVSLSAALWANPIVLIVGAIVAAIGGLIYGGYQLYKHWNEVVTWFTGVWEKVKQAVGAFFDWYLGLWGISADDVMAVVKTIYTKVSSVFNKLCNFISKTWNGILDLPKKLTNGFSAVVKFFTDAWGGVLALPEKLSNSYKGLVDFFSNLWGNIKDCFFKPFASAMEKVSSLKDGAVGLWNKATSFFSSDSSDQNQTASLQVPDRTARILNEPMRQPSALGQTIIQGENKSEVIVRIKTDENSKAEVEHERTTGTSLNTSVMADTGVTR